MNMVLACEGGCGLCLSRIYSVYISAGIRPFIVDGGMEKRKVWLDMPSYCGYLQWNYFVLTELALCLCYFVETEG